MGFFSLAGGTGRTTLAVEAAALLAVRGRVAAATGARGARVALLDLARRYPTVGLRLGLAAPTGTPGLVAHATGLVVGVVRRRRPVREAGAPAVRLEEVRAQSGADIVVVDFDCDVGEACNALLACCDQLLVTVTATPGGVVDAYRSTALLRGLGLRDRVGHVANRWRPGVDLGEVMGDLGAELVAQFRRTGAWRRPRPFTARSPPRAATRSPERWSGWPAPSSRRRPCAAGSARLRGDATPVEVAAADR